MHILSIAFRSISNVLVGLFTTMFQEHLVPPGQCQQGLKSVHFPGIDVMQPNEGPMTFLFWRPIENGDDHRPTKRI